MLNDSAKFMPTEPDSALHDAKMRAPGRLAGGTWLSSSQFRMSGCTGSLVAFICRLTYLGTN